MLLMRGLGLQQIPAHRGGANILISEQKTLKMKISCVVDPDPYVFGSPGSGSFYDQANIVRKTLKTYEKTYFFVDILKSTHE